VTCRYLKYLVETLNLTFGFVAMDFERLPQFVRLDRLGKLRGPQICFSAK
jgi:hypothetical protein